MHSVISPAMARKKPAPAPEKVAPVKRRHQLDTDTGVLTYTMPDGNSLTMPFTGLELPVLWRLAMLGAIAVISKRRHPAKAWELITEGVFGRDTRNRKIPLAVRALAVIATMTEPEALKAWRTMSPDERRKVKNDPAIRAMVSQIRAESLAKTADADNIRQWLDARSPA